jgi:hypothetical protein
MSDELRALTNALDDLLVAVEAITEDWGGRRISWLNEADWDNLTDAVERARALLYNPNDPMLNMSVEEIRQGVDEFDSAARLAEEGM